MRTVYSFINIAEEVCFVTEDGSLTALMSSPEDLEIRSGGSGVILHPECNFPFPHNPGSRSTADLRGPGAEALAHILLAGE